MIDISSKISMLRKSHNMTQQELADKLHISNKVVSKWELGVSEPDLSTLVNLAEIFNISIGELLGDTSPAPVAAKGDLNTRGYNFFRRNYMTIIQLVLIWAATMVAMIGFGYLAGYDLVISILPNHLVWGSIGLTIGMVLIQVFLTLIRPGHMSITILKSVLILALFALALSCYFYLGYTGERAQEFFIVAAITYTILFIVSILHLLLDLKVINAPAPFKLGKILFILVIVFTSLQCGVVLGQITNTAVGFYDLRTPSTIEITSRYIVLNKIGETATLKTEYPDFTRHDPFTFESDNPQIATVDANGVVTATGYGQAYIRTVVNGHKGSFCEINVQKPNFNVTVNDDRIYGKISTTIGSSTTFSVYAGEYFTTLGDFKNNFSLECNKPYALINESFMNNKYTVTVQFDSEYGSTSYDADFYIKSNFSNQRWEIVTVGVSDIYQINASDISTRAGMYFDVDFATYPTSITNYNYEILYDSEYIIEDNGRYVAIREGTTEMTIQLDNGISKTITVTISGVAEISCTNLNETVCFYINNEMNIMFYFEDGAYTGIPITMKVESDVENFATMALDLQFNTFNRYIITINALGEGDLIFSTPWYQIKKFHISSIISIDLLENNLIKAITNELTLEFKYGITYDLILDIANPEIASFVNTIYQPDCTPSHLELVGSGAWGNNEILYIKGNKAGTTEITITSTKTGETITETLVVT